MADLSQYTDEQLAKIAGVSLKSNTNDLSSYSDDELAKIAGVSLTQKGVFGDVPTKDYESGTRNIMGNIMERPATAMRGAGQGFIKGIASNLGKQSAQKTGSLIDALVAGGKGAVEGYKQGSINPANIPEYRELADEIYSKNITEKLANINPKLAYASIPGAVTASTVGTVLDIANNPVDVALATMGKLGSGTKAGQAISQSKPVKSVERFMTKERELPFNNLIQNLKNIKNPVKFAKNVRSSMFETKRQVGRDFGNAIDRLSNANLSKKVDISDSMNRLKIALDDIENNPGLRSEINSIVRKIKNPEDSKMILDLINNPEKATDLTLAQVQRVKNTIQNAPSIATKLKQGKFANWTSGDTELLDLIDDIKLAQSDVFPEMAEIRKPFAEYMQNYNEVKNMFKPRSLLNKIQGGFGNKEIEQMAKATMPEKTYKQIKGYRRTRNTLKAARNLAATGVGIEAIRRLLGNR